MQAGSTNGMHNKVQSKHKKGSVQMTVKQNQLRDLNKLAESMKIPQLVLTFDFPEPGKIVIGANRASSHLELAQIGVHLAQHNLAEIAKATLQVASRPDRYAQHRFDGDNPDRGCGICGRRWDDVEIHDVQEIPAPFDSGKVH
jgi:hypothetical protein